MSFWSSRGRVSRGPLYVFGPGAGSLRGPLYAPGQGAGSLRGRLYPPGPGAEDWLPGVGRGSGWQDAHLASPENKLKHTYININNIQPLTTPCVHYAG